jgi:hypothetical protein
VDANAVFPGGGSGAGMEAVIAYIREHRQPEFVDNLSRKLLAYALNRSLQLSDESVIESMESKLAAKEYRFDWLVETIVTSPEFRNRRVSDSRDIASSQTNQPQTVESQPRR